MRKFSVILITLFFSAFTSYSQGNYDICYDPSCIYVPPPPPPPPTFPISPAPGPCIPPSISAPAPPFNCPLVCWKMIVINDIDCELDFWWDYSSPAPCGDIVPAYWHQQWYWYSNSPIWPPINPVTGLPCYPKFNQVIQPTETKELSAWEIKWPSCSDNPTTCYCPDRFKFRLGQSILGASDPLVTEPWPGLSGLTNTTYVTSLNCGSKQIIIDVFNIGPNTATFKFHY